jgi:predicted N-acyltransferase
VLIDDPEGRPAAALPAYLKQHSQGEYVFDQGWADAWERAGAIIIPSSRSACPSPRRPARACFAGTIPNWPCRCCARPRRWSTRTACSAHATFIAPGQVPVFEEAGWLLRNDLQFHWTNRGYGCFDDFLAALSSGRRKNCARSAPPRRRACGSSG